MANENKKHDLGMFGDEDADCRFEIIQTHPDAILPERANGRGDSGWDLCSVDDIWLRPGERKLVQTGWKISITDNGWEAQIRSRSGNSLKKGLIVLNAPGTVDAAYQGAIGIILYNCDSMPIHIEVGSKVAQMVFQRVPTVSGSVVSEFSRKPTSRGESGYGSTGFKSKTNG